MAGAAVAEAAGGAATGAFAGCFSAVRGCSSLAVVVGGFTTTVPGDGATTTTGFAPAGEPAGALATTGPLGGRDAIAGVAGGRTIGGAERGCGTILRGAGAAGAAGAAAAGFAAGGAGFAGATVTAGAAGLAAMCGWRASSSSSFFLARIAFSTSPGLEMCERSIFGVIVGAALREDAVPA